MNEKKKIVVLTGAGISAESGIKTFRDADGLWEGHDVMKVASPEGWSANKELVLQFYNERRKQLKSVEPNAAHFSLTKLSSHFDVTIITQNVDNLHERSGSKSIVHLHGELTKSRSTLNPSLIYDCFEDINIGDKCEKGSQLRPHIVWFGEQVPELTNAAYITSEADLLIIVGTSMQVYPAAGLIDYVASTKPVYYVDPKPAPVNRAGLKIIEEKATSGLPRLVDQLIENGFK